jgi:hypothetical protein
VRKVKIERNTPHIPDRKEGDVLEVSNAQAEEWVKKGLVSTVTEEGKAEVKFPATLEAIPKDVDTKEPKRK